MFRFRFSYGILVHCTPKSSNAQAFFRRNHWATAAIVSLNKDTGIPQFKGIIFHILLYFFAEMRLIFRKKRKPGLLQNSLIF